MKNRETGKDPPFHITKGALDPRLADRIKGIEIHDIIGTKVDSSPDCRTPDSVRYGAGEQKADVEDDEGPSEVEVLFPATAQQRRTDH